MAAHSTPLLDDGIPNTFIPAIIDTSIIHEPSIPMSKGQSVISASTVRPRGPTKRVMTSPVIKRSASSPNVRAMASNEATTTSMADKRRNKLGYHRTSVACGQCACLFERILFLDRHGLPSIVADSGLGHCRRRKIRCLLAPGDPRGRCSNCIRLKKECNFYPVDQQPMPEARPRSGSKAEASSSNDAETPTSASPAHPAGSSVVEQVEVYHQLQPHPLQTSQETHGYTPYSASTMSPPNRSRCLIPPCKEKS